MVSGTGGRGALLRVDVAETLTKVRTDPGLLERAIANVVDNALTYSNPDQPVVIDAASVAGHIDVRVVDRGPGIPESARDRVLQPFQRLGDTPGGNGVGLGLAVAHGFVAAMGGELTIDDTPGGGTTIVISLPAAAHAVTQ